MDAINGLLINDLAVVLLIRNAKVVGSTPITGTIKNQARQFNLSVGSFLSLVSVYLLVAAGEWFIDCLAQKII